MVLLSPPKDLTGYYSTVSTAILQITYGTNIGEDDSSIVDSINAALEGLTQNMLPGRFAVDYVPLLEHVPAWFPGAGFHKVFNRLRSEGQQFKELLLTLRDTQLVRQSTNLNVYRL